MNKVMKLIVRRSCFVENKQHQMRRDDDKKNATDSTDVVSKRKDLRKKEDKIVGKIILVIALTLLIVGCVFGFYGLSLY